MMENQKNFDFIHSSASLLCFIFLVSFLKFSGEKLSLALLRGVDMDTDPAPDPDPQHCVKHSLYFRFLSFRSATSASVDELQKAVGGIDLNMSTLPVRHPTRYYSRIDIVHLFR